MAPTMATSTTSSKQYQKGKADEMRLLRESVSALRKRTELVSTQFNQFVQAKDNLRRTIVEMVAKAVLSHKTLTQQYPKDNISPGQGCAGFTTAKQLLMDETVLSILQRSVHLSVSLNICTPLS